MFTECVLDVACEIHVEFRILEFTFHAAESDADDVAVMQPGAVFR